ncbi:MAG: tetratricopeptide repeat protein [Bacteroidales bacterium]
MSPKDNKHKSSSKAQNLTPNQVKKNKNVEANVSLISDNRPSWSKYRYWIVFLLTFVLYGNTVFNDYALDDAIVITQNDFTQKGIAGIPDIFKNELFTGFFKVKKDLVAGGRYRPLSMLTFALEVEFFGLNPHVSHFINVLLFAFLCLLLFLVLEKLFLQRFDANSWIQHIPFLTTLLYLAHPIHTEVVANIKGRDEIMSLLGALASFYFILKFIENNEKWINLLWTFITYLLAMLSKEIAATFIVTIPLALWFFTNAKPKTIFQITLPLISAAIIYFAIRQSVVGQGGIKTMPELMNNSFLEMNTSQKYATIMYTMGIYIKLLFFPHPLTYDYYPYHIPITEWSHWHAWGSLLLILFLAWIALKNFMKKSLISFSILFYAVSLAPVSNFFFPVGVFMNERFVFVASIGFCLILAYFFAKILPTKLKSEYLRIALFVVLILAYTGKTIARNSDWKNDFTLFTTDVKVSVNGAKSNCSAGGKLIEEAIKPENKAKRNEYLKLALKYLKHSLEIYPNYSDALLLLGNAFFEYNKNLDSTIWAYRKLLTLNPEHNLAYSNTELVLRATDSVDFKIKVWEDYFKINPNRFEVNYQLGVLYGQFKNNLSKAKYYLLRAYAINPNNPSVIKDLGVAYGMSMQYDSSLVFFKKAIQIDPKDSKTLVNIGITYLNLNQKDIALDYFQKAAKIDPNVKIPINLNK